MRPSTSPAGPAPEGHFPRPRGNDSYIRQNPPMDPIAHRPSGRFSHRQFVPPIDPENSGASSSQPLRSPTISHFMRPSLDTSPAIYADYPPSAPHDRQFSHSGRHPNASPSTSHSTPDTPLFHDPRNGMLGYEGGSLGMLYPQDLNDGSSAEFTRTREWNHRESDTQGNENLYSNIPRIYVESQERPPIPYSSHSLAGSSEYTPGSHSFSPASGSSLTPATPVSPHDSLNSGLYRRHEHSLQRVNDYPRYTGADETDSSASRNFGVDTVAPTFTPQPADTSLTRSSRTTIPVPILRLDTTSLEPSGSRAGPRAISLGGYSPRGLTSPFDVPSPNPTSASSNPSPHSSTSSNITSPSPGASPMTFVPFQPGLNTQVVHIISEDTSITEAALREVFPPSSQCPAVSSSPQSQPARKWKCQWQGCDKSVRRQDRVAHALEHHGRKRFACSCGGSFARSQDKKRHVREQAICKRCTRSVGRNGYNGVCSTCSQENNNGSGGGPSNLNA